MYKRQQSDLSTFAIIVAASLVIIFSANIKPKDVFLAGFISLISLFLLLIPIAYRADRVLSVINPEQASDLHHKNQALISIGSGGLNGSGLGLSAQKFGFVPEAMSDSIFTIYAEELGFLGCAFLIFILMFFTFYTFSIAKKSTPFPKLMAIGIGTWIVVQSFINILAMSGLFPISGIPLPFLSYGGTHLVFELIAIGLLLNIARSINKRWELIYTKLMKIILSGGGTGGHIFPLIAVAREIKKQTTSSVNLLYLGPKDKFEECFFKNEKIKTSFCLAGKIRRHGGASTLLRNLIDILFTIPIGTIQAFIKIFFYCPDIIFSKGGYGSIPVVFAGALLGVPIVIHESDTVPGKANQIMSAFAFKVYVCLLYTSRCV